MPYPAQTRSGQPISAAPPSPPFKDHPANTRHLPNAGLMLARRRRRRAIIKPTLGERIVFAGKELPYLGPNMFQNALFVVDLHFKENSGAP